MKMELWCIGRTKTPEIKFLMDFYVKRIKHLSSFEMIEIPDPKKSRSKEEKIQKEGEAILQKLGPQDHVILLDEKGKSMSSVAFAKFIEHKMVQAPRRIIFIVGGAYGFSQVLRSRATHFLSLSQMTFPHDLVRVFFLEQVYRAFSIIHNQPYHHN